MKMLQQILSDMHIDPDLLAELDSEQKQILFCKMREEQLRRWRIYEEEADKEENEKSKNLSAQGNKKVQFLLGRDGQPWTWVMGDHPQDKSIDEILEDEARRKALLQAEKEAEDLRKKNEQNMTHSPNVVCEPPPVKNTNAIKQFTVRNISAEIKSSNSILSSKTDDWLKRKQSELKEHRANEIYASIRETQRKADELAEIVRKEQEELWKEREKKAKEAERQIREIARQAREEHKKVNHGELLNSSSNHNNSLSNSDDNLKEAAPPIKNKRSAAFAINNRNKNQPNKPPSKEAILKWFKSDELPRGSGFDYSKHLIVPWFHGMIGRHEAEKMLESKEEGTFLVRLSERIWGYAISYRGRERCKHFLIEAAGSHYQFFGSGHFSHKSLYDLIMFHQKRPITVTGGEYLLYPCSHDIHSLSHKELIKLIDE